MPNNNPLVAQDLVSQSFYLLNQQKQLSPEACEPIRTRVLELLEILMEGMSQDQEAGAITAMGPVVSLVIKNYEITKLVSLLTCLSGIAAAVLDLGSCQDEYNDRMEPLIRELSAALS